MAKVAILGFPGDIEQHAVSIAEALNEQYPDTLRVFAEVRPATAFVVANIDGKLTGEGNHIYVYAGFDAVSLAQLTEKIAPRTGVQVHAVGDFEEGHTIDEIQSWLAGNPWPAPVQELTHDDLIDDLFGDDDLDLSSAPAVQAPIAPPVEPQGVRPSLISGTVSYEPEVDELANSAQADDDIPLPGASYAPATPSYAQDQLPPLVQEAAPAAPAYVEYEDDAPLPALQQPEQSFSDDTQPETADVPLPIIPPREELEHSWSHFASSEDDLVFPSAPTDQHAATQAVQPEVPAPVDYQPHALEVATFAQPGVPEQGRSFDEVIASPAPDTHIPFPLQETPSTAPLAPVPTQNVVESSDAYGELPAFDNSLLGESFDLPEAPAPVQNSARPGGFFASPPAASESLPPLAPLDELPPLAPITPETVQQTYQAPAPAAPVYAEPEPVQQQAYAPLYAEPEVDAPLPTQTAPVQYAEPAAPQAETYGSSVLPEYVDPYGDLTPMSSDYSDLRQASPDVVEDSIIAAPEVAVERPEYRQAVVDTTPAPPRPQLPPEAERAQSILTEQIKNFAQTPTSASRAPGSDIGQVIYITGSHGGAGKTTTAYMCANVVSRAIRGSHEGAGEPREVWLVEADYRNSKLAERLGTTAGHDSGRYARFLDELNQRQGAAITGLPQMKSDVINESVIELKSGLRVVACPYDPTKRETRFIQMAIEQIVEHAKARGALVFIDADTLSSDDLLDRKLAQIADNIIMVTDDGHITDVQKACNTLVKPVIGGGIGVQPERISIFLNRTGYPDYQKVKESGVLAPLAVTGFAPSIPEWDKKWVGDEEKGSNFVKAVELFAIFMGAVTHIAELKKWESHAVKTKRPSSGLLGLFRRKPRV